jgi:uncharacterized protein
MWRRSRIVQLQEIWVMNRLAMWVFAIGLALVPLQASADGPIRIDWKHLLPKLKPLADPLTGLTQDQRFDLETIAWVRALSDEDRRLPINKQGLDDAASFERKFAKAGINVDKLLQAYAAWQEKVEQRKNIVNDEFNGKAVKLAGYLLPLEFSEKGNTDFLLVPYVGACIHVPPPPPNQIVFVKMKKMHRVSELFAPVYVSGVIKSGAMSKALSLVDGSSKISIGYNMDGEAIEPYK